MLRKFSTKTLFIAFLILMALVVTSKLVDHHKGNRTFKGELVAYQADRINRIIIHPQAMNGQQLEIVKKKSNQWFVEVNGNTFHADKSLTESIINSLNHLKPTRIASTQSKKWKNYQLTDSMATHLQLYNGTQLKADIRTGKTSSNQQRMITYIRMAGDPTVYGVNDDELSDFNRKANGYKSKMIIESAQDKWDQLTFTYPADSSFTLRKTGTQWRLEAMPADSSRIASYLSSIEHVRHYKLANTVPSGDPAFSLKIEGAQLNQSIVLNGYLEGRNFILGSSQNPGVYFMGNDLHSKFFVNQRHFVPKEKSKSRKSKISKQ